MEIYVELEEFKEIYTFCRRTIFENAKAAITNDGTHNIVYIKQKGDKKKMFEFSLPFIKAGYLSISSCFDEKK